MKKLGFYICILIALISGLYASLCGIDKYYEEKVKTAYFSNLGSISLAEKNQGLVLQEQSINRNDNMEIYGSSELVTRDMPDHPANIFKNKSTGFQIDLIGRGHSQSIIHAINIGALNEKLKGEKMVVILSPQWFVKSGILSDEFNMNFSEFQFYSLMFSKEIDSDLKQELAARVAFLTNENQNYVIAHHFAVLNANKNFLSKAGLAILTPYSKFRYKLLSIKDKTQSLKAVSKIKDKSDMTENKPTNYDWSKELIRANEIGKEKSSNNNFAIDNQFYNKYLKEKLNSLRNSYKQESYLDSPEYQDLKLLLEISKRKGLKPVFVSIPVHGKWYDYCGFSKEDRKAYYKKVDKLVESYGFKVIDLSDHEYEDYFFNDTMHIGWKGWVYVDREINEYYHNDR